MEFTMHVKMIPLALLKGFLVQRVMYRIAPMSIAVLSSTLYVEVHAMSSIREEIVPVEYATSDAA